MLLGERHRHTDQARGGDAPGSDVLLVDDERDRPSERPARQSSISLGRWLLEILALMLAAFLLAKGVTAYMFEGTIILSDSMQPTLDAEDRVFVNKLQYRFGEPEQGDIVVFLAPDGNTTDYIKRVIAVEGQTVDIVEGTVVIDGVPLDEPYVHGQATVPQSERLPVTVPPDHVWLMGDNRGNSEDSRTFGAQPVSRLVGHAFVIYWPVDRWASL